MRDSPAPQALIMGVNFVNVLLSLRAGKIRAMPLLAFIELILDGQSLTEGAARWIAESPKEIERAAHNLRLIQKFTGPRFRRSTDIGVEEEPELDLPRILGMGGYQN